MFGILRCSVGRCPSLMYRTCLAGSSVGILVYWCRSGRTGWKDSGKSPNAWMVSVSMTVTGLENTVAIVVTVGATLATVEAQPSGSRAMAWGWRPRPPSPLRRKLPHVYFARIRFDDGPVASSALVLVERGHGSGEHGADLIAVVRSFVRIP